GVVDSDHIRFHFSFDDLIFPAVFRSDGLGDLSAFAVLLGSAHLYLPRCEITIFLYSHSDQLFSNSLYFLCPGLGRFDPAILEQSSNEIFQYCLSLIGRTSKLSLCRHYLLTSLTPISFFTR